MKLRELVEKLEYKGLINISDYSIEVEQVSYNSKTCGVNSAFVCIVGEHTDGHEFYQDAVQNGAVVCVVERPLNSPIPQIVVESTQKALADIAVIIKGNVSEKLCLIGVTGTNGKTTVSHLLQKIIEDINGNCGLIGTLGYKSTSNDEYISTGHTTPQAPELQDVFVDFKYHKHIENVVMEVSSHSIAQHRIRNCVFNGAVFTNLTQDHLDFHVTMSNYFNEKAKLFEDLVNGDFAVVNVDDEYGVKLLERISSSVNVYTYSVAKTADIMAKDVKFSSKGAQFTLFTPKEKLDVNLKLNGKFSVYNALAAITGAYAMGISASDAVNSIKDLSVTGRFEIVNEEPMVIVDYAHTPDGLKNILIAASEIKSANGDLICLFGCGGDRDVTKRPKMGAIAEEYADKVVLTSDNPRSEDPQQIISDILAGFKSTSNVLVEPDRGDAIRAVKNIAQKDDVVVLAGKGHETYQILKDTTVHFDDREEAKKIFAMNEVTNA